METKNRDDVERDVDTWAKRIDRRRSQRMPAKSTPGHTQARNRGRVVSRRGVVKESSKKQPKR